MARVKLVSPVIDPNTGTIKVTVEVHDYPDDTRPGDFAQVHIVTERRPEATLVPRAAVFTEDGENVVFVVDGDSAKRRVVELGLANEDLAEIVVGVNDGERVVVKGQRALKDGSPVRVLEYNVPRSARRNVDA